MIYTVLLTERAEKDLIELRKRGNRAMLKKIDNLMNELELHPKTGTGKVEALKDNLSGYWSRRIDDKNRILYIIQDDIVLVTVVRMLGHYGHK